MTQPDTPITIPAPDELRRRIEACEIELKSLRRLLRMSRAATRAAEARKSREPQPEQQETACAAAAV